MNQSREFGVTKLFLLSSLLFAAAMFSGCYKPNIPDGKLRCAPGNLCPDGFVCMSGHCFHPISDAAVAEHRDSGADADGRTDGVPEARDATPDSDACMMRTGAAGCTPQSDLTCDPVCQTKCCTTQKCSAMNTGAVAGGAADLGCVPNNPKWNLGDRCDADMAGTPNRGDNCAPGLVCVDGNSVHLCMKLCRSDADCGDQKCETRPIESNGSFMASVCSLPPSTCDPTPAMSGASGCAGGFVCYLITSDKVKGDTTVCEISSGDNRNMACRNSRECLPGFTCPPSTEGLGAGICRPVCSHASSPANVCSTGTVCQTFGKTFDFCL